MKTNTMRKPLITSAVVLLIFILLAYLTSASPEGGVLNSLGLIIIGAFRFVQWSIAMVIGLAVCIAALIGIFLFAVFLVNKEAAADMYAAAKVGVGELLVPVFSFVGSLACKDGKCSAVKELAAPEAPVAAAIPAAPAGPTALELKDELQAIISGEVKKITDSQEALNGQLTALSGKLEEMEAKSGDFAAATQLEAIAGEIATTGQAVTEVKEQVATLESKLNDTVAKLDGLSPEKMLGDIPERLEKLEQQDNSFDPQPLTEAIEALKTEVEAVKATPAKKTTTRSTRAKKKA